MKRILTSALVVLAATTGFSQEAKWGVKGGLNITNLRGGDNSMGDNKARAGINAGVFVEYKVADKFYIQPELLVSTQGSKYELALAEAFGYRLNVTQKVNLTYLTLPIMLKYKVVDKLSVEFGPQFGLALAGHNKITVNDGVGGSSVKLNLFKDEIHNVEGEQINVRGLGKRFDFGLNFGASYDITDNFFVNARYNLGLTKVFDTNYISETISGETTQSKNLKNSVFQIGVGYKF